MKPLNSKSVIGLELLQTERRTEEQTGEANRRIFATLVARESFKENTEEGNKEMVVEGRKDQRQIGQVASGYL